MPFRKLIDGFQSFHQEYFSEEKIHLFKELVDKGQFPDTLVIACSDSRIDPAIITQSAPGDIFVVRNVAALVPPYEPDAHYHSTSAAIEYAVKALKVKNIVILGHALCGGVQALDQCRCDKDGELIPAQDDIFEFIFPWISLGKDARKTVHQALSDAPDEVRLRLLEQAMILVSLNNLLSFPWIKEAYDKNKLALHGWYFDLTEGKLLGYDGQIGQFKDIHQNILKQSPQNSDSLCLTNFIEQHLSQDDGHPL